MVGVAGLGRGGVAPPLFDAVYRVHVYLHVLARLEGLAAHGAGVEQRARRVHVGNVLLEVAVVAVQLAALGAGGLEARLTVGEGSGRGDVGLAVRAAPAAAAARPRRSWGRRTVAFSARSLYPTTLIARLMFALALVTRDDLRVCSRNVTSIVATILSVWCCAYSGQYIRVYLTYIMKVIKRLGVVLVIY